MTLIFFFNGSSGASVLPSFIASPLPRDHQWFPLMPFPMKSTANRFGNAGADCAGPHQAGNDSSHGRHIVTPAPRRTALFVIVRVIFFTSSAYLLELQRIKVSTQRAKGSKGQGLW